jgi:hypothetical protein
MELCTTPPPVESGIGVLHTSPKTNIMRASILKKTSKRDRAQLEQAEAAQSPLELIIKPRAVRPGESVHAARASCAKDEALTDSFAAMSFIPIKETDAGSEAGIAAPLRPSFIVAPQAKKVAMPLPIFAALAAASEVKSRAAEVAPGKQ